MLQALRQGMDIEELYKITKIDKWFLAQTREIVKIESEIAALGEKHKTKSAAPFEKTDELTWRRWKALGFGDEQIAYLYLAAFEKKVSTADQIDLSLYHGIGKQFALFFVDIPCTATRAAKNANSFYSHRVENSVS